MNSAQPFLELDKKRGALRLTLELPSVECF